MTPPSRITIGGLSTMALVSRACSAGNSPISCASSLSRGASSRASRARRSGNTASASQSRVRSRDRALLRQRHHCVGVLAENQDAEEVGALPRRIGDVARILARVALKRARPRDRTRLCDALAVLPDLRARLARLDAPRLSELAQEIGEFPALHALLTSAIVDNPPMVIRDGGVIVPGNDAELDELRQLSENAGQFLIDLETRERARTGIANLKVNYNRVHGFYIELTRSQAEKAPVDYIRRQTLKGAERYITPELKSFE